MANKKNTSPDIIQLVNPDHTPKITILDELKYFIPPLQPEEFKQLQANILVEGCRQALLVWKTFSNVIDENADEPLAEVTILIDGHNRYEICRQHGLGFPIQFIDFASLQLAKNYMIEQQLGRRNLNSEQMAYLRGLRYNQEKLFKGKYDRKNDSSHNDYYENNPLSKAKTIYKVADLYQVSPKTIQRDAEFAQGLDKLTLGLRQEVLSGVVKVSKKAIQQLAKISLDTPISSFQELIEINQVPKKTTTTATVTKQSSPTINNLSDAVRKCVPNALDFDLTMQIRRTIFTGQSFDGNLEKAKGV